MAYQAIRILDGGNATAKLTGISTDGKARWQYGASFDAEAGSNAGSNFELYRYDDLGNYVDTPFSFSRQTGVFSLNKPLPVSSGGTGTTTGIVPVGRIVTSGATVTFGPGETVLSIRKSSPSTTIVTLPANPIPWARYTVIDGDSVAATYNINVYSASGTLVVSITSNGSFYDFINDGAGWGAGILTTTSPQNPPAATNYLLLRNGSNLTMRSGNHLIHR